MPKSSTSSSLPKSSTRHAKLYELLAAPRARMPLAHRCPRALRCTSCTPRQNSSTSSMPKSST
eukprot:469340-Pyramimonas_sp.AAC.1